MLTREPSIAIRTRPPFQRAPGFDRVFTLPSTFAGLARAAANSSHSLGTPRKDPGKDSSFYGLRGFFQALSP